MKRLLFFVCAIGLMFGIYSCSNDFDLVDEWKDIPVVYGLLASPDDVHYVRVEKAFLDESVSAFDIAQIVDSLYYPNATVTLIRKSNDTRYPMEMVDGNLEGLQRDEGVFADAPNYLYKLDMGANDSLVPGAIYELEINRGDDLPLVTGETVIVSDMSILKPRDGNGLKLTYENQTSFQWRFEEENAIFFNIFIDFFYREIVDGATEFKSFRWYVEENVTNEDFRPNLTRKFESEDFFKVVGSNIPTSTGEVRIFDRLEFGVTAGGQSIYDYIKVNQVNTGITGSQLLPNFTNMSEGYGIFSSTSYVKNTVFLEAIALDSLVNGFYTSDLNFQ